MPSTPPPDAESTVAPDSVDDLGNDTETPLPPPPAEAPDGD